MYNYLLKFKKKQKMSDEEAFIMIEDYYISLHDSGQVCAGFDIYRKGNHIYLGIVIPDQDSLSPTYDSQFVKSQYDLLMDYFDIEFQLEGENIEFPESCTCDEPSWYYLMTNANIGHSPVFCGDCYGPVPMYRIPYLFSHKDHACLRNWVDLTEAMETLWVQGIADAYSYGEKVLPNSFLNIRGRELRTQLESVLDKPVYYYLSYFGDIDDKETEVVPEGYPSGTPRKCPDCGNEWNDDSEHVFCENCRLMADSIERKDW